MLSATATLPKIYNRFHSQQIENHITVDYPKGSDIMSGVKTQISLEHRNTSENMVVNIISAEPLRPHQLRAALNDAVGNHWDYKQLSLAAFDYEF